MARLSLKVNKAKAKQLADALDLIEAHVALIRKDWKRLTPENRRKVLDASPILARIVALTDFSSLRAV